MQRTLILFTFSALAFALMACAAPATLSTERRGLGVAPEQPPAPGFVADSDATTSKGQAQTNAASAERMIVYTTRLNLEVQDTEKAVNEISAIVAQNKGYIAATNLSRDSKGNLRGSITIRVPATALDAATKQIKAAGLKVLSEGSNANDVTDQYSDLNAQLKNLEATEIELRKLLETVRERTGKAEDILAVYNRLTEIRGQIERIKGQINVLEKTSALATMTIELTPKIDVQVLDPDTWMPNRTAAEALRALVQALQGLANLIIWLVLFFLPIGIVLVLPLVVLALILRATMRRRAKVKTPAA
ncbi:MAG: DUF4349 domain-containing protein [Chloroflexi bacterium]|nr:DUF4349 domain-containing protein [Chloroflexota bacterium]